MASLAGRSLTGGKGTIKTPIGDHQAMKVRGLQVTGRKMNTAKNGVAKRKM